MLKSTVLLLAFLPALALAQKRPITLETLFRRAGGVAAVRPSRGVVSGRQDVPGSARGQARGL